MVVKKVKENHAILPLMRSIWLEKRGDKKFSKRTLSKCRKALKKMPDERVLEMFYSLAYPDLSELGVEKEGSTYYFWHCLIQLLHTDEIKQAILKSVRGK